MFGNIRLLLGPPHSQPAEPANCVYVLIVRRIVEGQHEFALRDLALTAHVCGGRARFTECRTALNYQGKIASEAAYNEQEAVRHESRCMGLTGNCHGGRRQPLVLVGSKISTDDSSTELRPEPPAITT